MLTRAEANPAGPHRVVLFTLHHSCSGVNLSELATSILLNKVFRKCLGRSPKLTCGGKKCTWLHQQVGSLLVSSKWTWLAWALHGCWSLKRFKPNNLTDQAEVLLEDTRWSRGHTQGCKQSSHLSSGGCTEIRKWVGEFTVTHTRLSQHWMPEQRQVKRASAGS